MPKVTKKLLKDFSIKDLIALLSIMTTILISVFTLHYSWQQDLENREQKMLLDAMHKIDEQLREEIDYKIEAISKIDIAIFDLRAVVDRLFIVCEEYKAGKFKKRELEAITKKLQYERWQKRVDAVKTAGTMRLLFGEESLIAFKKFIKWDEEHQEICISNPPLEQKWYEHYVDLQKLIEQEIYKLRYNRNIKELRSKALNSLEHASE